MKAEDWRESRGFVESLDWRRQLEEMSSEQGHRAQGTGLSQDGDKR